MPEADYENIVLKPSEHQKEMVQSLAERAEAVRDRKVDATVDNMLKITNDGRKLALDQRLINDMLPDEENSKATTCVEKAFEIWEQTFVFYWIQPQRWEPGQMYRIGLLPYTTLMCLGVAVWEEN